MPVASSAFGHRVTRYFNESLGRARERTTLRFETFLAKPSRLHRTVFKYLRSRRPILLMRRVAFISRYEDVCRVLGDDEHFSVIYGPKVRKTTGPFVVGMGDTKEYHDLRRLMNSATRASDESAIRTIVKERCDSLLEHAKAAGRIDVAGGFARDVAATVAREYLGVRASLDQIRSWTRAIFREIFLDFGDDPTMGCKAQTACSRLKEYLGGLVQERMTEIQKGQQPPDDFLSRIITCNRTLPRPLTADGVYRIVAGTFVGSVDNISNSVTNVIDYLLDHRGPMAEAHVSATSNDDHRLLGIMLEALRFYPQNPFLIRRCQKTCTLAPWTPRATLIPANTLVLASTASAMFDDDKFAHPEEFRSDRPPGDYLHFGRGMHECFGTFIANAVFPATAKALLRRKKLRRARGRDGRIRYDGAFSDHLFVEFD